MTVFWGAPLADIEEQKACLAAALRLEQDAWIGQAEKVLQSAWAAYARSPDAA